MAEFRRTPLSIRRTMTDSRVSEISKQHQITQTKTFTRWVNSHLRKRNLQCSDLFQDLRNGILLMDLLEIITGEALGRPMRGKTRFHYVANCNTCIDFVNSRARLESIGGEDIVDGKKTLTLGLIWTIILRFQIQNLVIVDEEEDDVERNAKINATPKRSNKQLILDWCKKVSGNYPGVNIQDFSNSWRDGLGFNALIHAHRPDIIDFDSLKPDEPIKNLNNAFDVAHKELGVDKILDAHDIAQMDPDEKSILTYLASLYQTIGHMRRPDPKLLKSNDDAKAYYESLASELMKWILAKISALENRDFPNSLEGITNLEKDFYTYRTTEKPPKHETRLLLAKTLFTLQSNMRECNLGSVHTTCWHKAKRHRHSVGKT
ncbi:Spectrin beta chain, non-erythrocytic 1 [Halocaridina rubra]|uniref:Spectrin beta chain, non-erythrocytic 1 n=1 Tax=Halocaridina rubra TaxID=373956 RepID=A0AAN9FUI4_HALRR